MVNNHVDRKSGVPLSNGLNCFLVEVTNYLLSGTILHEVQVSNGYHFFVTTDLFKILSLSPFHLQPKSRPSFHMSNKAKHRLFRVMVGDETGYPVTFLGIIS